MKRITTAWLLLSVAVLYALDQISKSYIVANFTPPNPETHEVTDIFPVVRNCSLFHLNIIHIHNTGIAFGLGNGTVWAPYLFLTVMLLILGLLIRAYRRGYCNTRLLRTAWVLVMAGLLGNLTDRLCRGFNIVGAESRSFWENLMNGRVIDFLDFSFPWLPTKEFPVGYHWPAFNLADSYVCVAALLFVIAAFFFEPEVRGEEGDPSQESAPGASQASATPE